MKTFPIAKLNEVDRDYIGFWIDRFGGNEEFSLGNRPELPYLLRFWNESKAEYLFDLFGEELILSREVEIKAPREVKCDEMNSFIRNNEFLSAYKEFIDKYHHRSEYQKNRDLDESLTWESYYNAGYLVSFDSLYNNKYEDADIIFYDNNGKKIRIQKGSKTSKALINLNKKFNFATPEAEESFRIQHSQILNLMTLKGTLHLSIHPLDYITMSDNNCGWSSCMNWRDAGDYRMGTIEMMNSPMVIVAYLDSKKPFYLDPEKTMPWADKKWRELFIINKDTILGIKGYPYINRELEEICLDWLKELAEAHPECGLVNYTAKKQELYNDCEVNVITDEGIIKTISANIYCNYMYNDIYDKHYGYVRNDIEKLVFDYSGESECLGCGKDIWNSISDDHEAHWLLCDDCNDLIRCECCGDYISENNAIEINGKYYCQYCHDEYLYYCPICGQMEYKDNMYNIHLAHLGKYDYSMLESKLICYDCYKTLMEKYNLHDEPNINESPYWRVPKNILDLEMVPRTKENWEMLFDLFDCEEDDLNELWEKIVDYINMEDIKKAEALERAWTPLSSIEMTLKPGHIIIERETFPVKIDTLDLFKQEYETLYSVYKIS